MVLSIFLANELGRFETPGYMPALRLWSASWWRE